MQCAWRDHFPGFDERAMRSSASPSLSNLNRRLGYGRRLGSTSGEDRQGCQVRKYAYGLLHTHLQLTLGYQRLGALINSLHALVSFGLRGMWRAIDEEIAYGSEDRRHM